MSIHFSKTLVYIGLLSILLSCRMPYALDYPVQTMRDIQYPFEMKTQQLSGEKCIAYADEGKGSEVLVFVHGLGSYAPAWKKNLISLKSAYRCIAVDLPGYGKSCKGSYEASMTFFAHVLIELLDSLRIQKVNFVGHSMGGQISMTIALLNPERVSSLILVAPAGFERFDEGEKQWFREVVTPRGTKLTTPQLIQANLTSNFYKYPKEADFMIADRIAIRKASDFDWYCYSVSQSVQGMVNEPVLDKLHLITQPVLILFGAQDNLIPNRFLNGGKTKVIAEYGANQIKKSTLVMLDKCGHFAQFEQAEQFNTEVVKFLSGKR